MRESRSEVWHVAQRRLVALLELRRLWTTGNSPLATLARVGGWRSHMTDARTIIREALGPEVPASWRKQVADRMFTALRSAGFEVCAVAAPTITPQPEDDLNESTRLRLLEIINDDTVSVGQRLQRIQDRVGLDGLRRVLYGVGGSITPHPEACATCGGTGAIKAREGNDEIGYEQAWDQCPDCIGGVHLTPHPEARETDTGFSVTSEEYLAQIEAAVERGDAPAYLAEMLRNAIARDGVGGSITPEPTLSSEQDADAIADGYVLGADGILRYSADQEDTDE